SGTTFLLTKHLEAVCTTSRTGFDWVGGVGLTATWSRPFFYGARHVEEVAGTVAGTTWSIGYVPPDLTLPAISTLRQPVTVTLLDGNGFNPITIAAGTYSARPRAALQNQSGAWVLPTPASGVSAMASVVPPAGAAATNPANWGLAGSISDPIPAAAYPISGFVWMNAYSCYSSTDVGQGLRGFFSWHTNAVNTQITTILNARQFGRLPGNWQTAVRNLVVNAPLTRIAGVREVLNPNCTGRPGA
ncbi:MAG TPA: hypothetical protein VES39_05780, partial [Rhodospirillales bacterium]|nr:hypothetical protein [Rhodospirillales bacterium]